MGLLKGTYDVVLWSESEGIDLVRRSIGLASILLFMLAIVCISVFLSDPC